MGWKISKEFDFCYGHRVWSQKLNPDFSIDNRCVCRHLHGHQGKILVSLESNILTDGMVTDFKHLNWFKKFIDDSLDHKFIIDQNDPMFNIIIPTAAIKGEVPFIKKPEGYSIVDPGLFKMTTNEPLIELLEGFVIVDFVPTSENLSKWLFDIVTKKMREINVDVSSVQFYETPKSQSTFIKNTNTLMDEPGESFTDPWEL